MKTNRSIILGQGMYGLLLMVCLIGSLLCPMDPYHQPTRLKNLPPSTSYLDVPDNLPANEVLSIVSGLSFSSALLQDGRVRTWGDAPFDDELVDVKELAAGDTYLVVLHQDHHVSILSKDPSITLPKVPSDEVIEHIYAYGDLVALLSNTKQLYVSSLSHIPYESELDKFQSHIVDVAMNTQYMALVLDDGTAVILGEQDRILSHFESLHEVRDVVFSEHEALFLHLDGTTSVWKDGQFTDWIHTSKIKELSASVDGVFALGVDGHLFATGENEFHCLDVPDIKMDHVFADTYQLYASDESSIYAWGNKGFLLGSDAYGRDQLTRLFHGGLLTMSIGFIAVITETILGTLMGLISGYLGGVVDAIIMRCAELLSSIPFLPLMITLSAFLKDVLPQHERIMFVMVLYGILASPNLARIIRSQILAERKKEYVISAKLLGANTFHILRYELLPQIAHLLLVNLTLSYADSVLLESSLSFLGFGVSPPYPTWGNLLEHAQSTYVLEHCWWQWVFPALCIFLCVWSIHLIAEGYRKQLDPKDVRS